MTLDQLAQDAGLTKSFLSRIENDAKAPSIGNVVKLARALNIPVGLLFGDQIADSDIHLVRATRDGKEVALDEDYSFFALSPAGEARRTEAFLMTPPRQFKERHLAEHAGEESLFVVSGRIEVKFADRSILMSSGDYLQFPGHLTHQVRRLVSKAIVLIVISRD